MIRSSCSFLEFFESVTVCGVVDRLAWLFMVITSALIPNCIESFMKHWLLIVSPLYNFSELSTASSEFKSLYLGIAKPNNEVTSWNYDRASVTVTAPSLGSRCVP